MPGGSFGLFLESGCFLIVGYLQWFKYRLLVTANVDQIICT